MTVIFRDGLFAPESVAGFYRIGWPESAETSGRFDRNAQLYEVDPAEYAALAVPGGFQEYGFYDDDFSDQVASLIRAFVEARKPVAEICVGALPPGNAGVLKGRRATTYHVGDGRRRRQLADFGAEVVDERVVADRGIITSTAPETAVDVALALLALLMGEENALNVRRAMGFPA